MHDLDAIDVLRVDGSKEILIRGIPEECRVQAEAVDDVQHLRPLQAAHDQDAGQRGRAGPEG